MSFVIPKGFSYLLLEIVLFPIVILLESLPDKRRWYLKGLALILLLLNQFKSVFPKGICISRPLALVSNLHLPVLAHDLYLPALALNLYLTALAQNMCLPALGPNLYLLALASNLLFTSSGHFTTTTTATCTITTTTITTTATTATTSIARDNNNKRCLRGSKIYIKLPLKEIWWKSYVLFQ